MSEDKLPIKEIIETLSRRISCEEIVSYGIFAVDKENPQDVNFFALEEVEQRLYYINPRNTMLQLPYIPQLRSSPLSFYEFSLVLINQATVSLQSSISRTQAEIGALNKLKDILSEIASKHA